MCQQELNKDSFHSPSISAALFRTIDAMHQMLTSICTFHNTSSPDFVSIVEATFFDLIRFATLFWSNMSYLSQTRKRWPRGEHRDDLKHFDLLVQRFSDFVCSVFRTAEIPDSQCSTAVSNSTSFASIDEPCSATHIHQTNASTIRNRDATTDIMLPAHIALAIRSNARLCRCVLKLFKLFFDRDKVRRCRC
jgi:hypothetical protein